jgi:uncharacterized membrane protein YkoI
MSGRKHRWIVGGALAVALAGGGTAIAVATVADDDNAEVPITGNALDRASAVALEHTGGGRVTGTEVGDEEGYYEVEITLADGSQVDVHLDEGFQVINGVADRDGSGDD